MKVVYIGNDIYQVEFPNGEILRTKIKNNFFNDANFIRLIKEIDEIEIPDNLKGLFKHYGFRIVGNKAVKNWDRQFIKYRQRIERQIIRHAQYPDLTLDEIWEAVAPMMLFTTKRDI